VKRAGAETPTVWGGGDADAVAVHMANVVVGAAVDVLPMAEDVAATLLVVAAVSTAVAVATAEVVPTGGSVVAVGEAAQDADSRLTESMTARRGTGLSDE